MGARKRDVLTESAPSIVWLQVDTDGNHDDRSEPIPRENWSDLTWCAESIGGQEVTYIRTDFAAELIDAVVNERVARRKGAGAEHSEATARVTAALSRCMGELP